MIFRKKFFKYNFKSQKVFQNLVSVLSLRQKPQKSVRFRNSTGTKSSKTAQKNFSKNRQDVYSTRYQPLEIKKNFKVGSGYFIRGIPLFNFKIFNAYFLAFKMRSIR